MTPEDRVAAALHDIAGGVIAPPDGEARLTGRLRREHRRRRAAAVLGAASAVVGIAMVAGSLGSGASSAVPDPLRFASAAPSDVESTQNASPQPLPGASTAMAYPPPEEGVGGPRWFLGLQPEGKWAFHDAITGESSAAGTPTGFTVTAIAVGGDERAYYTAATKEICGDVHFDRVEVVGDDVSSTRSADVPGTNGVRGQVVSMALSHDRARLAYAIATTVNPDYPQECTGYELRVLDLQTKTTRTWTGEDATLNDLTWAPDDRTLLFHAQGCCGDYQPGVTRLDTRASGRTFTGSPTTPGTSDFAEDGDSCPASVTAATASEVFVAQECFAADEIRVVVLDPVTGRVVKRVATVQGSSQARSMSVSADGQHVLLSGVGADQVLNVRIDAGSVSQLPTRLDHIAW